MRELKVLFVEPPKDFWFVMGEYLPPPLGILQLAAYLEREREDVDIHVLDCQAEGLEWKGLEARLQSLQPDVVASSGLTTCNAYTSARLLALAKKANPETMTVAGGQHFSALAQESLDTFPEIDVIIRGEGEQTLAELVDAYSGKRRLPDVRGLSYRHNGTVYHNQDRPLMENMDDLPFPGYHFVEDAMAKYHFTMMAGRMTKYALIEGSRGCQYRCTFCTQWKHWQGTWRTKSAKRIADEMEFCSQNYDSKFLWLTDDNFNLAKRGGELCDEIVRRGFADDIMWFVQARCDDLVRARNLVPRMRRAGVRWVLLGVERQDEQTLKEFNKQTDPQHAKVAVKILKENDIFSQAMFIIGHRKDTSESIADLRNYVWDLDPDLAMIMILTPFPGTELFNTAKQNGWIEDYNWANYDMVHATMPTETLTRKQVQEEFYECYRSYYGSWTNRLKGILSRNKLKRRTYRYLARQSLLRQLREFV